LRGFAGAAEAVACPPASQAHTRPPPAPPNHLPPPTIPQGGASIIVTDAGQLDKFKKRFAGLEALADVSAAAGAAPPSKEELKKLKAAGANKGKGAKRR
jgi:hypothetical protein